MFLVLVTGLGLWLTYGITKGELPIIVANSITLTLASPNNSRAGRQGKSAFSTGAPELVEQRSRLT